MTRTRPEQLAEEYVEKRLTSTQYTLPERHSASYAYLAGFQAGIEMAAELSSSLAKEAFLYEDRDETTNRPGSKDFPRNAYNMASIIEKYIPALLTKPEDEKE